MKSYRRCTAHFFLTILIDLGSCKYSVIQAIFRIIMLSHSNCLSLSFPVACLCWSTNFLPKIPPYHYRIKQKILENNSFPWVIFFVKTIMIVFFYLLVLLWLTCCCELSKEKSCDSSFFSLFKVSIKSCCELSKYESCTFQLRPLFIGNQYQSNLEN